LSLLLASNGLTLYTFDKVPLEPTGKPSLKEKREAFNFIKYNILHIHICPPYF